MLDHHLESQAGPLAGRDRGVHVIYAELPGQAGSCRTGAGTAAEPELNGVVADRDKARLFGPLVGRAQAQLLVETPFGLWVLNMQDRHELGDQVAHGLDCAVAIADAPAPATTCWRRMGTYFRDVSSGVDCDPAEAAVDRVHHLHS